MCRHQLIRRRAAASIRDARSRQTTAVRKCRSLSRKMLNTQASTKLHVTMHSTSKEENTNRSTKCTTSVKYLMMKAKTQPQIKAKNIQKLKNNDKVPPELRGYVGLGRWWELGFGDVDGVVHGDDEV